MAFPSSLPKPRADSADRQLGKGAGRFEPDAGPAAQWATTTADFEILTLVYRCSASQRDDLVNHYRGEGARGGTWFDFTNPFTLGGGQARYLVGQEPKERPLPPKFEVSIVLEFLPAPA